MSGGAQASRQIPRTEWRFDGEPAQPAPRAGAGNARVAGRTGCRRSDTSREPARGPHHQRLSGDSLRAHDRFRQPRPGARRRDPDARERRRGGVDPGRRRRARRSRPAGYRRPRAAVAVLDDADGWRRDPDLHDHAGHSRRRVGDAPPADPADRRHRRDLRDRVGPDHLQQGVSVGHSIGHCMAGPERDLPRVAGRALARNHQLRRRSAGSPVAGSRGRHARGCADDVPGQRPTERTGRVARIAARAHRDDAAPVGAASDRPRPLGRPDV